MKKAFKNYAIAWAVFALMFNVIVFVVQPIGNFTKTYDARFWVAWAFANAAFVGQLFCASRAFRAENSKKFFLSVPVITESYAAMILMTVAASVIMLIPNLEAWVAAVVCVLIFGFSVITVLKAETAADLVQGTEKKVQAQTFFIKNLTADAQSLLSSAAPELQDDLTKVYEAVRYSDPMSVEALASAEAAITLKFSELTEAVNAGNTEPAKKLAKEVIVLIKDRNNKIKLFK